MVPAYRKRPMRLLVPRVRFVGHKVLSNLSGHRAMSFRIGQRHRVYWVWFVIATVYA